MSFAPMPNQNPFPAPVKVPARPTGVVAPGAGRRQTGVAVPMKPAAPAPSTAPPMQTTQVDPAPTGPVAGGPAPSPTGPATTPAPNAPAPGAPTQGVPPAGSTVPGGGAAPGTQAPAAPIGTPGTAASQPLEDSPWAYEKLWGALGSLGDSELDAMVKAQTMGMMKDNPYGAAALEGAKAAEFERGMAGLGGQKEAMAADLARRGISGPAAAAMMAEMEAGTRAGIADRQSQAESDMRDKGAAWQQQAVQTAQALSSELANRGVNIETLRMNREQLARQIQQAQRAGAGGDDTIEIVNPDGSVSQVPLNILGMVLDMEEGGMF
jgi:hypothetical protein